MKFIIKSSTKDEVLYGESPRYFLAPGLGLTKDKACAYKFNSKDHKHVQLAKDYTKHQKNYVIVPVVRP